MKMDGFRYWWGWWALLIGGIAFALRWRALVGQAFAPGWDGYFYLIQVKAWVEEGAMHSVDRSPIYLLLRGLSTLTGDYLTAYQLLCALLAGSFAGLSVALARRISGDGWLGLTVGAWCVFSPSLTFFAAQFPKNLLGMNALLLLLLFSVRGPGWAGGLAGIGAFWAHRMTAGLSLIFVVLRQLDGRRMLLVLLLGAVGIGGASLVPGLLRVADWERFSGAFREMPQLAGWSFVALLDPGRMPPAWIAEIVLAHLFLLYWVFSWSFARPTAFGWSFAGLCVVLLFPFFEMDVRGMGYRFFLTFMLLAPQLFAIVPHLFPREGFHLVTVLLVAGTIWHGGSHRPETFDPDYGYYQQIVHRAERVLAGKEPELIIGHKGLAELMTFETGIDVLPWQPEYAVDSSRLWRIAAGISAMEFRYYLGPADEPRVRELGIDYALLPESVWQRFVAAATEEYDADLQARIREWRNPRQERPGFLRK